MKTIKNIALAMIVLIGVTSVASANNEDSKSAPISQNALIAISNNGITPSTIHFKQMDGLLFFINNTDDALITLKVNFGTHKMHCASDTMVLGKDGFIASKEPIGPKDFVSMCFPDIGRYEFVVYGVPKKAKGVEGVIIVE